MLRCACRIAFLAIFAGQYSCIDKQYDLSDLDTDDVTIGNELTLPLGTGIIAAGDIVHIEDNDEITVDDAGNYVARYSGQIGVDMPGRWASVILLFGITARYSACPGRLSLRLSGGCRDRTRRVLRRTRPDDEQHRPTRLRTVRQ
ncbi:MAG: DUF4621 domain-containing protein [Alistipes sp.]